MCLMVLVVTRRLVLLPGVKQPAGALISAQAPSVRPPAHLPQALQSRWCQRSRASAAACASLQSPLSPRLCHSLKRVQDEK
jgi:hypothetical protein